MSVMGIWFNNTFQVERKLYSDEFGDEPYQSVGTIKGLVQPVGGRYSQRSGKESAEASYMLYTAVETVVEAGDRITDSFGRVWIAQFVQPEGISAQQDHQEIPLELVT